MSRVLLKPIHLDLNTSESIHRNVSLGYYETTPQGVKRFVPYTSDEMGEIHSFISPFRDRYKRMKWTKTNKWKDQTKAKKSRWKYHPTYGGLNTAPRQ